MTQTNSVATVHEMIEETYDPTIYWGNQESVAAAVRACAFASTMPYTEVSASAILPSGVDILFRHGTELPAWHLFTDFASADPDVQNLIMRHILSLGDETITDVDGVFIIASSDSIDQQDQNGHVRQIVAGEDVNKFRHVSVDGGGIAHPFPVG